MLISKELKQRFKISVIVILSLFVIGCSTVFVSRSIIIGAKKGEVHKQLQQTKFQIHRFQNRDTGEYYFTKAATIAFEKNTFKFNHESIEVTGMYKLINENEIELKNCSDFETIICGDYYLSLTKNGLNLVNDNAKILCSKL